MLTIPGPIPITIHPYFWLLCLFIGFINGHTVPGTIIWSSVVFVSVLIHEYGHALTAILFGQKAKIDLVGLGGLTSRHGKQLKLWQEFVIVLNGPIAGLCLAAISFFLFVTIDSKSLLTYALEVLVVANIFWTILNLLPIYPLDGGRLLSIILEGIMGVRGIKIALFLSILIGAGFAVAAFAFSQILVGSIFFLLAFESWRTWRESIDLTSLDQNQQLRELLQSAEEDAKHSNFTEAENKLRNIREQTKQGVLYTAASLYLAQILARTQQYEEAYNILKPLRNKIDQENYPFLHQLAWKTHDLATAIAIGDETYQVKPDYETALINSFSYALMNQVTPAIGWLKRAISDGLPNLQQVLQRKEFDKIRHDPLFHEIH